MKGIVIHLMKHFVHHKKCMIRQGINSQRWKYTGKMHSVILNHENNILVKMSGDKEALDSCLSLASILTGSLFVRGFWEMFIFGCPWRLKLLLTLVISKTFCILSDKCGTEENRMRASEEVTCGLEKGTPHSIPLQG